MDDSQHKIIQNSDQHKYKSRLNTEVGDNMAQQKIGTRGRHMAMVESEIVIFWEKLNNK